MSGTINRSPDTCPTTVRSVHDLQTLSPINNADSCSFEPTKQHRCLDRLTSGCHLRNRDHARASTDRPHASDDEPAITLSNDLTRTLITRTDRQPRPSPLEPVLARSMTTTGSHELSYRVP
uniref:Uncharacterized protein n=1 Tax=Rhodococcus sp. NS1 TaxID=402236 RepID=A0A097SQI2_9NOCA|nr:hypothetical protein LRS1606.350 [Rhodococcus sp. NS1]